MEAFVGGGVALAQRSGQQHWDSTPASGGSLDPRWAWSSSGPRSSEAKELPNPIKGIFKVKAVNLFNSQSAGPAE